MTTTAPSLVAAALFAVFGVGVFIHHYRQPQHSLLKVICGCLAIALGFLILQSGATVHPTNPSLSVFDALRFQYPDFYQGTVLFELGRALILGPLLAEIFLRLLRKPK